MLRNYLKVAWRNLTRQKAFSVINILGLSIGMACTVLIALWVRDELSYDKFHPDYERIYRITASLEEMQVTAAVTPAPIASAIKAEIPGISETVRVSSLNSDLLEVGDLRFEEKRIMFADSTFFELFSYPLLEGDGRTALDNPDGVILTQSMAIKYFGNQSALGKTLRKNHKDDLVVTGVLYDIPSNGHLQFDFIQPMANLARTNDDFIRNI